MCCSAELVSVRTRDVTGKVCSVAGSTSERISHKGRPINSVGTWMPRRASASKSLQNLWVDPYGKSSLKYSPQLSILCRSHLGFAPTPTPQSNTLKLGLELSDISTKMATSSPDYLHVAGMPFPAPQGTQAAAWVPWGAGNGMPAT